MKDLVAGKTVAIVGRAGSILRTNNGPSIDAADVVIRINWVLPIPEDQFPHVGSRTDLIFHCKRARTARITATGLGVPTMRCSGKARRIAAFNHFEKAKKLRPTTGFMAIVKALTAGAREVRLYGFDFFQSGHSQEREPDGDDYSKPLAWAHSPTEERKAMRRLVERFRGRLIPDRILEGALK
jgi:hypothetical protein